MRAIDDSPITWIKVLKLLFISLERNSRRLRGKKCLRLAFAIIWNDYENYFSFSLFKYPKKYKWETKAIDDISFYFHSSRRRSLDFKFLTLRRLNSTLMIDMIEFDLVSTIF